MPRDAAATRTRILDAATVEFSRHGLAGARVDRLAERADANKQLIYAYFGSKEGLFDATLEAHVEQLLDAVPFDASDLPAYCCSLFDFVQDHPDLVRLALWHGLERTGGLTQVPHAAASTRRKVEELAAAQSDGTVDGAIPAAALLEMLLGLAHGGPEGLWTGEPRTDAEVEGRRRALGVAVRRLCEPTDGRARA